MHFAAYLLFTTFLWQANILTLLCSPPKKISSELCTCTRQQKCYSIYSHKVTSLQDILSIRNKITSFVTKVPTILTSPTNHQDMHVLKHILQRRNSSVLSSVPSTGIASEKGGWSCLHSDLSLATTSSLSSGHKVGRVARLFSLQKYYTLVPYISFVVLNHKCAIIKNKKDQNETPQQTTSFQKVKRSALPKYQPPYESIYDDYAKLEYILSSPNSLIFPLKVNKTVHLQTHGSVTNRAT